MVIWMDLQTTRLLLRPIAMRDLDEYVAIHADAEVTHFIGPVDRRSGTRRLEAYLNQWGERGHGMFAVLDSRSCRFLGVVGLDYWAEFDEMEVGWVLRRDAWGQGFATEAARACITWGFSHLRTPYMTSMIRPDNRRSVAVAERIGMSVLRPDVLFEKAVIVYALSRTSATKATICQ
jgi:RimJ/RimL family protein N-acetyltransferase